MRLLSEDTLVELDRVLFDEALEEKSPTRAQAIAAQREQFLGSLRRKHGGW